MITLNNAIEERTLEIRDVSTIDNQMKVAGYVNKNGSKSEILSEDGVVFQETILPQAFSNALSRGNEICFFLEHDPHKILATTKNNTLEVTQDSIGLHMSATIVRTSDGQDAYNLIKSGIITSMSFGFLVNSDLWDTDNKDIPLRTVTDLDLLEVSAVKNPAYQSSTISARSKNSELLDKSKVNFRAKGGVKNMELSNFSIEDLKQEIAKRSADEPKADEQPKVDEPKVEKSEEGTEETAQADSLSQRDWYNLTMAICRAKGIEPQEKRDGEDVVSEPAEDESVEEPKEDTTDESTEEKVEEQTDSQDAEEEKEDEPKEESKDVEADGEKEDESTDEESDESTDEEAKGEDEPKDEEPKEVKDGERSVKDDFPNLDDLLKEVD